jgi:hypothetical protein
VINSPVNFSDGKAHGEVIMTDLPNNLANNTIDVSENTGTVVGSIIGGKNIFGQIIYVNTTDVTLAPAELRRAADLSTAPARLDTLRKTLIETHSIILYAPPRWGVDYVAEHLAKSIRDTLGISSTDKNAKRRSYFFDAQASGADLSTILANPDRHDDVRYSVIIVLSAQPSQFREDQLTRITQHAHDLDAYLIFTTNSTEWGQKRTAAFVPLDDPQRTPYTEANYTAWLCAALAERQDDLESLQIVTAEPITAQTRLGGLNLTVAEVVRKLNSPARINDFANRAVRVARSDQLVGVLDSYTEDDRVRLTQWFAGLEDEARYFVIALSLVDGMDWVGGLRQETFWAIYEQLTQRAWRERNRNLKLADYLELRQSLEEFISLQDNRIRFRNSTDRRKLIEIALDRYRRALVQALPILADIVTVAYKPADTQSGAITGRLNALDIFGTDLEPSADVEKRQTLLRDSLALSIAQIHKREPNTTENLLLAWAQGTGERSDTPNRDENVRLRLAVSRTLVQMWRIPRTENETGEPHRDLLRKWYELYGSGRSARAANVQPEQRTKIRATIALSLCHLARAMRDNKTDFFGTDDENTARLRLLRFPDRQFPTADIKTLWDMVIALAWDDDPTVRSNLIFGTPEVLQSYPLLGRTLIDLMASDSNVQVRSNTAQLLSALVASDGSNIGILYDLLQRPAPLVTLPPTFTALHYLYEDRKPAPAEYPWHFWTAVLGMLIIGETQPSILNTFVNLYGNSEDATAVQVQAALRDVLMDLVNTRSDDRRILESILKPILIHRTPENKWSRASQLLEGVLVSCFPHRFEPIPETKVNIQFTARFWRAPGFRVNYRQNADRDRQTLLTLLERINPAVAALVRIFEADPATHDRITDILDAFTFERFQESVKTHKTSLQKQDPVRRVLRYSRLDYVLQRASKESTEDEITKAVEQHAREILSNQ